MMPLTLPDRPLARSAFRAVQRGGALAVLALVTQQVVPVPAFAAPPDAALLPDDAPVTPSAAAILENALRSAGSIDRAVNKPDHAFGIAPQDSPDMRMRRGMQEAHDSVPPRIWEAPRIEELVNQSGNGDRRDRIVSGLGTYCITELATRNSIDKFEKEGKRKLKTCPLNEAPATHQE